MNATTAWLERLKELYYAPVVTTRGAVVHEQLAAKIVVDMREPFVNDTKRKLSDKFRFAEAYWILTGDNRVSTIREHAPSIEHFSDNGHVFQGAYGPKVTEQLRYVCETLLKDKYTRQAVISIWRENPRDSKDIPCTLSLQFLVRHDTIHCVATMRSSDVWLGLPYDIFNFSCITNWVRLFIYEETKELLKLGNLTINMGSSHLYARNWEAAYSIILHPDCDYNPQMPEFETVNQLMGWLRNG